MEKGRESSQEVPDDQGTTSGDDSEGVADTPADSQDSSDVPANQETSMVLCSNAGGGGDEREYADFQEAIEPCFSRAEGAIKNYIFDLSHAKDLVVTVRDLGERRKARGCEETKLEDIVLNRAMRTVTQLVDGVVKEKEEVFDPRQTTVYLYSAMAIFATSLQLMRDDKSLLYHMSPTASKDCYENLHELHRYCAIKTGCEPTSGWHNTCVHKRVLLDLAAWLEVDRPPVTYMIARAVDLETETCRQVCRGVPGMHNVIHRLEGLCDIAIVLSASSLVRLGFLKEARDLYWTPKVLLRVNLCRLTPMLVSRREYVYARLLQDSGEFVKAMEHAIGLLQGATDREERREIEQLINELNDAQNSEQQVVIYRRSTLGPADPRWLPKGLSDEMQSRTKHQETARQDHHSRQNRKKSKRVAVPRERRTPSPAPRSRGPEPSSLRNTRRCESSPCLYSSSPSNSAVSSMDLSQGAASSSSRESLLCGTDSDSDEEEEVDVEAKIKFVDFYEEDDLADDDQSIAVTERAEFTAGEEQDQRTWYERSEEAVARGELDEEEGEDVELSERQASSLERGGEGRAFYTDFHPNPEQLLKDDPDRFKRCQLKIERCHKAIAKVLDKGSKYTEILIDGRSKAGRTYMDDEVVVEILAEPGNNRGLQQAKGPSADDQSVEKLAHGKVVGLLKRVNFASVEHPVLFCTLDEMEGHLMRPLCKTVPKIHVMNDTVRRKYRVLKKNRIEIKALDPDGNIQHKGFFNVQPDKREQYVFKVVMVAWRQRNIYPLGAVLEAHIGGRDYAGGLVVLSKQQRVPKRFPRAAVEDTQMILQQDITKTGREDLTGERLFTIDPAGSRDLDDAISIKKKGQHYVIGVHIADVAAVVKKGSGVDLEAKKRAVTFYPLNRQPHPMIPEPLSHAQCSLLPGKERLAFSVFFTFDDNFHQVNEPVLKRTVIKSCQQLTYEEAQSVIDDRPLSHITSTVQTDIQQMYKITSRLRDARKNRSILFVPFEDPRLPDLEKIKDHKEAHALIEELMVLTNSYIACRLRKRPSLRNAMLVRCHKAPTWEELQQWQETEGNVSNLVMQLQGQQVSPNTQVSMDNKVSQGSPARQSQPVVVQSAVWTKLCQHLERGEVEEARRLAFMDDLHPLQCLANNSWMDMMDTAQYKCLYGLNGPDLRHFGLALDIYTHFTSPIRRYADLHVQRLLHADLDGRAADCTPDEVTELSQHINSATSRQKAFGKGCMALKVADSLQAQPLVFRAYVERVDTDQLTLHVPSLQAVSDRKQELTFSMLGVSKQPELITDTALKQDFVTVQWNKRVYDANGTCPPSLLPVWKFLERQTTNADPAPPCAVPSSDKKKKKTPPLIVYINPDLLSRSVRQNDWLDVLKALESKQRKKWRHVPQPLQRTARPLLSDTAERDYIQVDFMSSERGDESVSLRPVQFKRAYTRGQVVQVQMSAEPRRGVLKPRVEILHTAKNASVCTQHVSEPVVSLSRFATRATRDQNFSNYREYAGAWMPLMEMEAAVEAGSNDGGVVIENVTVKMRRQDSSAESSNKNLLYRGTFRLKAKLCFDRCIEFGGKSSDDIKEDEFKSDNSFPVDYLCLRYKMNCSDSVLSRIKQSTIPETVDRQFTWIAHAAVVRVNHLNKAAAEGGELAVTFVLTRSSPHPPTALMSDNGDKVTLEILPKGDVDRRAQRMLLRLEDPKCNLAQAIAFGKQIPKLEKDHRRLGRKTENHEVFGCGNEMHLPSNNMSQLTAIQKAMTSSLAIVQGPPGTGKTNTGIKLVYLFCKVNRQLSADGKGKKTVLYCGPSNKSVDLVARELKAKLGSRCPKIVRVYGSAIESKDYPVPRGDLRSARSVRDLNSDRSLQDVTLHHLIRQGDRPYAKEIGRYDKYFEKCLKDPVKNSVTSKMLKKYRKLLGKASFEELAKYEVVLTTVSVGGSRKMIEGTGNSVYQVIIDECAMSPEPQSMVPIIATQAKQVVLIGDHKQLRPIIKCQPAAEMGLDQSLFERLFHRFPACSVFLKTQYRMHPAICEFPSKEFYKNNLETAPSKCWEGEPLGFWPRNHFSHLTKASAVPHLLVDVKGEEETLSVTTDEGNERSKSNALEADKVIEILGFLKTLLKQDEQQGKGSVIILTQYNAQRHMLEQKLHKMCEDRSQNVFDRYDKHKMKISTVVSSQGGEWDYVILSTVRSLPSYKIEPNPTHGWCRQNLGFITDRNQVNVALTRARRGLIIVGNVELLRCDDVWRHLVERYERLECVVSDASQFPPPPPPSRRNRNHRMQRSATSEWQRVERPKP